MLLCPVMKVHFTGCGILFLIIVFFKTWPFFRTIS
uniref:Uncharacterized protein n=1 Tax=Anguilla anguilla TaxID=7936 RepID=A0A0E9U556_ANGAN